MTQRRHKIAFISTMDSSPWGGSEELWTQTAERLIKRGVECRADVKKWPGLPAPRLRVLQKAGCEIAFSRNYWGFSTKGRAFLESSLVAEWIKSFRPDLALISQGIIYQSSPTLEACVKSKVPFAIIFHAIGDHVWPSDVDGAIWKDLYRSAVRCYFVSENNRSMAEMQLVATLKNAEIVRNPYNVPYFQPFNWPKTEAGFKLACVGRLDPISKGQDILFQVMAQNKWRQRPVTVTLFGNGRCEKAVRSLKAKHKLKNVVFGGFVSDVEKIWKTHHALLLPSRYEGLPLAVVEAMLCGRPCVVVNAGGNAELIEHGENGFVAESPTIAAFDRALEEAWARKKDWPLLGKAAMESVRQSVPVDPAGVFADKLLGLIEKKR